MRLLLPLFLLFYISALADTIEVCARCKTKTIKGAISIAIEGDTILVKKGIYKETKIDVSKSIHIIGVDYPVLDAENKAESIFTVKADEFTISGFKFINVGMSYTKEIAGVFVSESTNFTIKNNQFENVFYGFIVQRAKYGVLQNNTIKGQAVNESNSGNGLHIWKCSNMRIEQNTVFRNA